MDAAIGKVWMPRLVRCGTERFRPTVVTAGVRITPALWTRQALATGGSGSKDQCSGAQLGSYGSSPMPRLAVASADPALVQQGTF